MAEQEPVDQSTSDWQTTIGELREVVRTFVAERDWNQFHAPKNLSMALAIEAAELMEHFQWLSVESSRELTDPEKRRLVAEEMSDVFCYLLALANELDLDITDSLRAKMVKNEKKYPAEKYQGRYE